MVAIDKATAASLAGDPRRPGEIVEYKRPAAPEGGDFSVYALTATVLSTLAMLVKIRIFTFFAAAFMFNAWMHKSADTDVKQLMTTGMFVVMSLFMQFLAPSARGPVGAAAGAGPATGTGGAAAGQHGSL